MTTRPKVSAIPGWVIAPPETSLITMAPVPANTRQKVPIASAAYFLIGVGSGMAVINTVSELDSIGLKMSGKSSDPGGCRSSWCHYNIGLRLDRPTELPACSLRVVEVVYRLSTPHYEPEQFCAAGLICLYLM